ncbi:hypothetical protein PUN28_017285 [Cardiocondyla obscurior]|uniref:Ribosomal protein S14 n=1 Tax=Cardiocondyla obscurior TaxID=286306 RepID=A0AAW2ENT5_9HYME
MRYTLRANSSKNFPILRVKDSARSQNPRSVYCWRNGATLHSRPRIDRRGRKKKERKKKEEEKRKTKRRSFIMELRNCKLSKYNGRPLGPRAPKLAFCLRHRALRSMAWISSYEQPK